MSEVIDAEVVEQTDNRADPYAHNTLAKALLAAQKEMPAVKPDAVNPHFRSKFVSLGHLIAKVRPVLNKHGLMVAQFPAAQFQTGAPTLVTILLHESGERMEYEAPLLLSKQDPQGLGSALTYMKRYALAAALGIADQEDDDGNAGSKDAKAPDVAISDATAKMLRSVAQASSVPPAAVTAWLKAHGGSIRKLTPAAAEEFSLWLEQQSSDAAADTEGM